jgi:predicted DCC family thiol-disulfide oxidoreductase YuxK
MGTPVGRAAGAVDGGQPPPRPPAVLIYDGDCAMCRASALWLMRLALAGGQLEILPCRSAPRRARYPHITDEACMMAMQLVLPDGRTLAGADAVPELLRRIRGLGWVATVFALPGARPLSRRVYAWIARNRMHLSCSR